MRKLTCTPADVVAGRYHMTFPWNGEEHTRNVVVRSQNGVLMTFWADDKFIEYPASEGNGGNDLRFMTGCTFEPVVLTVKSR